MATYDRSFAAGVLQPGFAAGVLPAGRVPVWDGVTLCGWSELPGERGSASGREQGLSERSELPCSLPAFSRAP